PRTWSLPSACSPRSAEWRPPSSTKTSTRQGCPECPMRSSISPPTDRSWRSGSEGSSRSRSFPRIIPTAQVRFRHGRVAQHRVGRTFRDLLTEIEHNHVLGEIAHQLYVVLDPQHRGSELVPDAQEE